MATLESERDELRLRKMSVENEIRKLKLMKRAKQVMSRPDWLAGVMQALNDVRMLIEELPERLGMSLEPHTRNDVREQYRKALFDLLTQMANRANEEGTE